MEKEGSFPFKMPLALLFSLVAVSVAVSSTVDCSNSTSRDACMEAGSALGANTACVWCGTSPTTGHCHEPIWAGEQSCPCTDAVCFELYGCPAGVTEVFCGSSCIRNGTVCLPHGTQTKSFTLVLKGSCEENATAATYSCAMETASQRIETDISELGISTSYQDRDAAAEAKVVATFSGNNPTPSSFVEEGALSLFDATLKFTGAGELVRLPDGSLAGSGFYNVQGLSGAFANRTGIMSALNYGSHDGFISHVTVRFFN